LIAGVAQRAAPAAGAWPHAQPIFVFQPVKGGMASGPSLEAFVATEQNASPLLGGRSVFGWEEEIAKTGKARSG
jgi:hypothetical protein